MGACIFVSVIHILPFPVRKASSILLGYTNHDCTISRTCNLGKNFLQHFRLHPVCSENGYLRAFNAAAMARLVRDLCDQITLCARVSTAVPETMPVQMR